MTFELDETEVKKFAKWKHNLPEIPEADLDVFGRDYQFTFKFHPTGLGVAKIVERVFDGEEINLTNFDDW